MTILETTSARAPDPKTEFNCDESDDLRLASDGPVRLENYCQRRTIRLEYIPEYIICTSHRCPTNLARTHRRGLPSQIYAPLDEHFLSYISLPTMCRHNLGDLAIRPEERR